MSISFLVVMLVLNVAPYCVAVRLDRKVFACAVFKRLPRLDSLSCVRVVKPIFNCRDTLGEMKKNDVFSNPE